MSPSLLTLRCLGHCPYLAGVGCMFRILWASSSHQNQGAPFLFPKPHASSCATPFGLQEQLI